MQCPATKTLDRRLQMKFNLSGRLIFLVVAASLVLVSSLKPLFPLLIVIWINYCHLIILHLRVNNCRLEDIFVSVWNIFMDS